MEYGLRLGVALNAYTLLSVQIIGQSSRAFDRGETWLADLVVRFKLTDWLEAALGGSLWADWETSPRGNKKTFYKFIWGIAFPF
jgi:hypothetical protein